MGLREEKDRGKWIVRNDRKELEREWCLRDKSTVVTGETEHNLSDVLYFPKAL